MKRYSHYSHTDKFAEWPTMHCGNKEERSRSNSLISHKNEFTQYVKILDVTHVTRDVSKLDNSIRSDIKYSVEGQDEK